MIEQLKELTRNQINKIEDVLKSAIVIEDNEVFALARSYFEDAKYFFEIEKYIDAFEAITISWAYIDACLHFNKIKVDQKFRKYFTI